MKEKILFYNNIPEEMKAVNHWVCYRITEKDGKKVKMPISAKTGKAASTTEADTWTDFNTAVKYCETNHQNVSGIGFVFSDNDDIVGIDFDDCLDTDGNLINGAFKKLSPEILLILNGALVAPGYMYICVANCLPIPA